MANPIQALRIDTNILDVKKQFDELINYINNKTKKPFEINFNLNGIQQQIEKINTQFTSMGKSLNLNVNGTEANGAIDSFSQKFKVAQGEAEALVQTTKQFTNELGQNVKIINDISKATGEVTTKTTILTDNYKQQRMEAEKLTEAMAKGREQSEIKTTKTDRSDELKQAEAINKALEQEYNENLKLAEAMAKVREQSATNNTKTQNTMDANQEKAIIENQNISYKEAVDLLEQKYKIINDISIAEQKGYSNVLQELQARQSAVEIELQSKTQDLTNENQYNLRLKENELIGQQQIGEAKLADQEKLRTAEIEKQIALIKDQYTISMQNLNTKYGSLMNNGTLPQQVQEFHTMLNGLDESNFNKGAIANQFKQIEANVKASSSALRLANQDAKGFGDTLLADATKFALWMTIGTLIMQPIRAIEQAITDVKELDDTINDLKMDMMSTSQTAFDGLVQSSRNLSIALGSNISDIDEMMKVYANANITVDEIMKKTKPAAILTNITDMSATESVDAIQSIMLQFDQFKKSSDDVATQATHVTDVLASVGQSLNVNFKTGVSSISEAIKVSGAVINEAGISYEKYASIVGKVAEVQRVSGSTIGNAMKTIASRISRANSGDASDEDISKADKAYKSIGIDIRDATGNFKDLDSTLNSLSTVWGNLNSVQKSYIAEQSAGVNFCSPI